MFPGVNGFQWDAGHVIFLGAFFSVVVLMCVTMALTWFGAARNSNPRRVESIRWHMDFSELPASDRRCRHEISGEIAERQCPNEFDCRHCTKHPQFVQKRLGPMSEVEMQSVIAGMPVPLDRLYHRGHTWARKETSGDYSVGLDPLALRLLGPSAKVEAPTPGSFIYANGTAFRVRTEDGTYRILSPVTGEVLEVSDGPEGRILRMKAETGFRTDHLLAGCEVTAWLSKEIDRLQIALGGTAQAALADGGAIVDNLPQEYPDLDWDNVRARMLLNS